MSRIDPTNMRKSLECRAFDTAVSRGGGQRLIIFRILTLLMLLPGLSTGAESSPDMQLLDGLRQRRLFSLAELECRQLLARQDLNQKEHSELVIELSRTYARHALNAQPADREPLWTKAHQTIDQFLQKHPDNARNVLVKVQDALTSLAQGELARMEAEIASQPQQALNQARMTIRRAAKALGNIDEQLTRQIALSRNHRRDPQALTGDELFTLQNQVRYQLARAYRNQALCYPPESDDRIAALSLSVEQLKRTMSRLSAGDVLAWKTQLDQAICYRLQGDLQASQHSVTALLESSAPESIRISALAEQVRLLLAAKRPEDALAELAKLRSGSKTTSPVIDFVQLETYLALWKASSTNGDRQAAGQWQKKASDAVAYLEHTHGAYWGRRGEMALLQAAGGASGAANVDVLQRAADNFYLKGRHKEAIATYEKGARQAAESGDQQKAFSLQFKAALIEQEDKQFGPASLRLERIAHEYKTHPKAAQAQLLAAWNAAQITGSNARALLRYETLLRDQLTIWPNSKSANTARMWLGRVRESQQDWKTALDIYQKVATNSIHFAEAVAAAARCWQQWLRQQQKAGKPTDQDAIAAATFFESVIRDANGSWPKRWNVARRTAAIASARIRLAFTRDGFSKAEQLLQAALQHNPNAPATWIESARTLLIVALAGQPGRQPDARQLLENTSGGSVDRLLELINGLTTLNRQAGPNVRRDLSILQLAALQRLQESGGSLDKTQQRQVGLAKAEALVAAGRQDDGLHAFQQLATAYPNSQSIQMSLAELLLQRKDKGSLDQALQQWRRIARRLRPGTDAWYQAKYSIALACFKRGDISDAAKRLRYLKATSKVDQSSWAQSVDRLLKQCR